MAEGGEKRDPKTHRTPSQKREHAKAWNAKPAQKKRRAQWNKARREAIADGRVKKGDGKDVHHVKPLSSGGSNSKSNTRVMSKSANRAKQSGGHRAKR